MNPSSPERGAFGFLEAIEPLIRQGRHRFRDEAEALVRRYPEAPFAVSAIEETLATSLEEQLLTVLGRTMVLELQVARLQGLLSGATAAERFDNFLCRLRQPEVAAALLEEYPVLANLVTQGIDDWTAFSLEFLRHLCADWQAIRSSFRPDAEPGPVIAVEFAGDRHRGGRSVLIVTFRSGWRLVYKPKPLAVEVHFQRLLAWLNAHGAHPAFPMTPVLDRGGHGWVAFVAAYGCSTEAEIQRFYQRQGAYLALLYGLRATDFHLENVIAAGEQPVPVDLEALFHHGPADAAGQLHADSVRGVRFLPHRSLVADTGSFVDFSSLGATAGQLSPYETPCWEGMGTDEMRVVPRRMEMPAARNRPTLRGQEINLFDYREELIHGFQATYRMLETHREELLDAGGPIDSFARDEVRFLARTTQCYALLLRQSYHPDLLRDGPARSRFFRQLDQRVAQSPWFARLRDAEDADLLRQDIPLFTTRPASRDLWTSSGERIVAFFEQTGVELVRQRLRQLGPADLQQQLTIIRATFAQ